MTRFNPGQVVLIRFPFTDQASKKRRPAMVICPVEFSARHGDIVVVPLTGREQNADLRLDGWREAGLLKPTWLKPLVATVNESFVERSLGVLTTEDQKKVQSVVGMLIDTRFVPR
jgi:mRNA interferase MazF